MKPWACTPSAQLFRNLADEDLSLSTATNVENLMKPDFRTRLSSSVSTTGSRATFFVVAVILGAVASSCRTTKFSAEGSYRPAADAVPTQTPWPTQEPLPSPTNSPLPVPTGAPQPTVAPPVPTPRACVPSLPPVNIVIAVDKSSSMSNELRGVREGLSYFTSQLQTKIVPGFGRPITTLRYFLIGYEDVINNLGGPWAANNPAVQTTVNSWFARVNSGGSDTPEGGIMAIREAFKILAAQPQPYVPVVVLITDALSHDGGGRQDHRTGRFDSLDPYLRLAPFKSVMLFSAPAKDRNGSGDFDDNTDRRYRSGWDQMDGLRAHIRAVAGLPGNAYVGENFVEVRNFRSQTLGDIVASRIASNLVRCP